MWLINNPHALSAMWPFSRFDYYQFDRDFLSEISPKSLVELGEEQTREDKKILDLENSSFTFASNFFT